MQSRRRSAQPVSLYQRLNEEAQRLRKEAKGTQPGIERERIIRKARQAETTSQMNEWLKPSHAPASPKEKGEKPMTAART
jgi:hypothetical protein